MSSVRRPAWGSIIPVLTLLAGVLFAASASTARGTNLREQGRTRITELITAEQRRGREERAEYRRLRAQVDAISREAGRHDARVREAREEADRLAAGAGFTPYTGPAVSVTLDDAPAPEAGRLPHGARPDDLVVHQSDVQAVVNALWAGGARAMQIMDQRVISTSAVRCVGNTLILQGVVYSPPFRIIAAGDPDRLRAALGASEEIAIYRRYVRAYGLGYAVRSLERATLPPYTGNVTMKHATVPTAPPKGG
ncbi:MULTISPECIES: DUF881 domain-containing protein [Actinomadura]|uniref:Uncharacterized conserved protein YlxW, UPF0749 family n=1 Tax=Actinomadura madurae TaxID=1993 RepID=A0A1I5X1V4_9ACTN|nr:DUF881 domain-containing protein [Actinomadura madurae]SFQ25949.1 Uncharacterized conserved protein YlxW, UPF0749 family [Actinomadura madurae]SPT60763.1 Bacterial protein of uncharacterised function (DUF881) [Actinomadura madurae]